MIRALIAERTDPVLFALSYDYVGDLSETVALMWPADPAQRAEHRRRSLTDVVETLVDARQGAAAGADRALARRARRDRPLGAAQARHRRLAHRRLGAARQDRGRLARRQGAGRGRNALARPGAALHRAVRLARRPRREAGDARSGAVPAADAGARDRGHRLRRARPPPISRPNGNGTASACRRSPARDEHGEIVARLYSRTGEDISKSFPDLLRVAASAGAIDGELLIMRDGRVQSFNVLQQRLNRKAVTPKLHRRISRAPARLRSARRRR